MERIKEILNKYNSTDFSLVNYTINTLCSKGVGNGVYQNYQVLCDILSILEICKAIVNEDKNDRISN